MFVWLWLDVLGKERARRLPHSTAVDEQTPEFDEEEDSDGGQAGEDTQRISTTAATQTNDPETLNTQSIEVVVHT